MVILYARYFEKQSTEIRSAFESPPGDRVLSTKVYDKEREHNLEKFKLCETVVYLALGSETI